MSDGAAAKSMTCFACKEVITSEQFVLVGENNYHLEHFLCQECKKPLAGQLYYEHNEGIYCEEDYHNLFSPKCEGCKQPIKDKYLNVMGRNYHQSCFVCFLCSSQFENGQYFKQDERPVCLKCYSAQAKKCASCGEAILTKVYSALEKYWHFECFKCAKCGENFKNESFVTMEGKPFHQRCHQILCTVCEKPVAGEYYQVEGNKALHKECVGLYKERKKKENEGAKAKPKEEKKDEPKPQKQEPKAEETKNEENLPKIEEPKPQLEESKPKIEADFKKDAEKPKIEENKREESKQIEEPKPKIEESISYIEDPRPQIEGSKQSFQETRLKNEEEPKPKNETQNEESNIIEDRPKPLQKPLILDESKTSGQSKVGMGFSLGVPFGNPERKRGSVLTNASNYEVFVPEFEEKKVETLQEGFKTLNVGNLNLYPYEVLTKAPFPSDVEASRREEYLGDSDFLKVFNMTKSDFVKLPVWKKNELKKKAKLF